MFFYGELHQDYCLQAAGVPNHLLNIANPLSSQQASCAVRDKPLQILRKQNPELHWLLAGLQRSILLQIDSILVTSKTYSSPNAIDRLERIG